MKKDQYNPFMSTGYASLLDNSKMVPIEILQILMQPSYY